MVGTDRDNAELREAVNANIKGGHEKIMKVSDEIQKYANIEIAHSKQVSDSSKYKHLEDDASPVEMDQVQLEMKI